MEGNNSANARIAKNSIFMSIRMVLVMCITFYTTKVILSILGVEDYGIYNVVCGFVSMFTFLNTSMSNGIQRFFNYEYGRNEEIGAIKVFNNAIIIQSLLVLVVIVLAESIGIWFLNNKINIPVERLNAAHFIFQCAVINFTINILQVPFVASIMAHEHMGFYALVNVINAVLKLSILYILSSVSDDNLIAYGALSTIVSVIIFICYLLYCKLNFKEIRLARCTEKKMFFSMLGFSGWNMFGALSGIMKEQGINLLLNIFFGPIVNAARAIASQINSGLLSFVQNITVPVRPQITKSYAIGDINRTMNLAFSISKLSSCFLYLCALPIFLEMDFILKIWLGDNIPSYTHNFTVIVILISFINNLNSSVSAVVHASNQMRDYQLYTSLVSLMCIPVSYIALSRGANPESALIIVLICVTLAQILSLYILRNIVQYKITDYIRYVISPFVKYMIISILIPLIPRIFMEYSLLRFIIVFVSSIISSILCLYVFVLNSSEKQLVESFLKNSNKLRQ